MKKLSTMLLVVIVFLGGCMSQSKLEPQKEFKTKESYQKRVARAVELEMQKLEEERINLPNAIIQEKAVVGKTLSIYGIEFNKVFNGSNATYKYFYNKDYNPVISVGKKNGTGIWYVVYTLSQADKIVKEIRLQLSYQDRFECMKTKNKIMDNLYNKYGGKYQNQLEIIEKQLSVVSSITHTSRARIDLNDIVIAASCYQDGGYSSNEITIKLNDKSLRKKQDIAIDNL